MTTSRTPAAAAANGKPARKTPAKRLPPKPPVMPPLPPETPALVEDDEFQAFWGNFQAEGGKGPDTKVIMGVRVVVPTDLPLFFEDIEQRMLDSKADLASLQEQLPDLESLPDKEKARITSRADQLSAEANELFAQMLTLLFGPGTYDQWKTNGMTAAQLQLLTTWGMLNARRGGGVSFDEAGKVMRDAEAEREAEAAGKPVGNRANRRAAAKKKPAESSATPPSASTGQRSKRTSRGSTARPSTS